MKDKRKIIITVVISLLISRADFVYATQDNDKEKARFYHQQSSIFSQKGDYDQAIKYEEKAIELDPTTTAYRFAISSLYFEKGMYDKVIQTSQKILELLPENDVGMPTIVTYQTIARAYAKKKEYNQAIKYYNIAIKKSEQQMNTPDDMAFCKRVRATLYSGLAKVYEEKKEFKKANELKKKAEEQEKEAKKISGTELPIRRLLLKDAPFLPFLGFFYLAVPLIIFLILTALIYLFKRRRLKLSIDYPEIKWGIKEIVVSYLSSLILGEIIFISLYFTVTLQEEIMCMISDVGLYILSISFIIYYVKVKYKQSLRCIGLTREKLMRNIWLGLAGGIGTIFLIIGVVAIIFLLASLLGGEVAKFIDEIISSSEDRYKWVFSQNPPFHLLLFYFLVLTVFVALAEEMFFRGFIYAALRQVIGRRWAMVLSSLFFGLLHTELFITIITSFLAGLCLVYLYERTKSLIPCIVAHSFMQAGVLLLTYFFPS